MNIAYAGSRSSGPAVECGSLRLRPATAEDRAFLRDVFVSTRIDEFSRSGLSEPEIRALLDKQFELQDGYYRRHYPGMRFDVVTHAGIAAGRLYHYWGAHELRIIDIALLPPFRGAGIGSHLMRSLVAQAAARELAATLYVETANPVKSLYGRLGFFERGEEGIYELMQRDVAPFDGESAELAGL